jgi:hypothetical protein
MFSGGQEPTARAEKPVPMDRRFSAAMNCATETTVERYHSPFLDHSSLRELTG